MPSPLARVDDLDLLRLIASALTAGGDAMEAMEIGVRQAIGRLSADGGLIAVVNDGIIEPTLTVGYTREAIEAHGPLTLSQQRPLTDAIRRNEVVWVTSRDDAAARFPSFALELTKSSAWAAVPLALGGLAFGVLALSFSNPRDFAPGDRLFLGLLADLAALALLADSQRAGTLASQPTADVAGASSAAAGPRYAAALNYQVSGRMAVCASEIRLVQDRGDLDSANHARLTDALEHLSIAQAGLRSISLDLLGKPNARRVGPPNAQRIPNPLEGQRARFRVTNERDARNVIWLTLTRWQMTELIDEAAPAADGLMSARGVGSAVLTISIRNGQLIVALDRGRRRRRGMPGRLGAFAIDVPEAAI